MQKYSTWSELACLGSFRRSLLAQKKMCNNLWSNILFYTLKGIRGPRFQCPRRAARSCACISSASYCCSHQGLPQLGKLRTRKCFILEIKSFIHIIYNKWQYTSNYKAYSQKHPWNVPASFLSPNIWSWRYFNWNYEINGFFILRKNYILQLLVNDSDRAKI